MLARKLFVSAVLSAVVVGGVAYMTGSFGLGHSAEADAGQQPQPSLQEQQQAGQPSGNGETIPFLAPQPTVVPQQDTPLYVYPDGSIAPAPGSDLFGGQQITPSRRHHDDDEYEGRGYDDDERGFFGSGGVQQFGSQLPQQSPTYY